MKKASKYPCKGLLARLFCQDFNAMVNLLLIQFPITFLGVLQFQETAILCGGDDGEAEPPCLLSGTDGLSIREPDSKGEILRGDLPS